MKHLVKSISIAEGREFVRILLAAGADPTVQDAQQRTALHTAAMANDVELLQVRILIRSILFLRGCPLSSLRKKQT